MTEDDKKEETEGSTDEADSRIAVEAKKDDDTKDEKDTKDNSEAGESSNPEVKKFMDNYRKIILSMKDSDNFNDENLAINAIQCRAQANALLTRCGDSDKSGLENVISACEKFITRFSQEIKKG